MSRKLSTQELKGEITMIRYVKARFAGCCFIAVIAMVLSSPAVAQTASNLICNACVGASDIANGAVRSGEIANSTILSQDIKDGAIKSQDIANNAITGAKILNGTVTSVDMAPSLNLGTGGKRRRLHGEKCHRDRLVCA